MKNSRTHSVCSRHNIGDKSTCCGCENRTDCSNNTSWEERFDEKFKTFSVEGEHCEFSEGIFVADVDILKDFINTVASESREGGIREALELIPARKEYPFYNGRTNPDSGISGWNYHEEETRKCLSALLKPNGNGV